MNNFEKYITIAERIQEKHNNGEITFEEATSLNDEAFEKYVNKVVIESKKDDVADLLEDLADKVKDGKVKLEDDLVDTIKGLLSDDKEESDEPEEKEESDDDESADGETEECKN